MPINMAGYLTELRCRLSRAQCLTLVVAAIFAAAPLSAQHLKVGDPLGSFTLATVAGDSVRSDAYRGRPLIVKFWATWCPTCRTEMPEIVAARSSHRDAGLEVITINGEDPPARIQGYLAKLGGAAQELPVLLDPKSHLGRRLGVPVLPTTVFIDSAGVVRTAHYGAITPAEFDAGLRGILPGPRPE